MTTMTAKRTDIHRPSAINPEEYYFVECYCLESHDIGEALANIEARKRIREHMERTGGRYSNHDHGGTCHVCGAHANYLAVFYHEATNRYICTGFDCAAKMDMGDKMAFRALKRAIADARQAKAGKMKAQAILTDAGMARAWELYAGQNIPADREPRRECHCGYSLSCRDCQGTGERPNSYDILRDIVGRLVQYGNISDKQLAFLAKLVDRVDNYAKFEAAREAKRAAEAAAAADCPTGRVVITGEVISTRSQASDWGLTYKMLVKDDRGFKVWGTVPAGIDMYTVAAGKPGDYWQRQHTVGRGDRVEFTATLKPSPDDPKFGFASRPAKAKMLASVNGPLWNEAEHAKQPTKPTA